MKIIVNGVERHVPKRKLTYEEVCILAFGPPAFDEHGYTATYYVRGGASGSLVHGQSVKLKAGMVFNCVRTNKA